VYFFVERLGQSWIVGLFLALAVAICFACVVHWLLFHRLRNEAEAPLILLLASLGIYIVLQNSVALAFGTDPRVIRRGSVEVGHRILGAYLTGLQLVTIAVGLSLFVGVLWLINCTRLGQTIRAVSSDPDLASVVGVRVNRVKFWVIGIGSTLGAVAGILAALDTSMTPTMGFRLLLNGMIVMIIGGVGSVGGLLGGALLLAAAQNFTAYYLGNKWTDAVAFLILIGFLIWKPLGFSGQRLRKVEV
jgi:branched-chain amino acid transport system permease protein